MVELKLSWLGKFRNPYRFEMASILHLHYISQGSKRFCRNSLNLLKKLIFGQKNDIVLQVDLI